MAIDVSRILDGLKTLRKRDPQFEIFGAQDHRYELYPVLSEDALREFEQRHGCKLPEDYRTFLLEIGNGGAGPCYGVFRLGEMDDGWTNRPWPTVDGLVGDLSQPFPHTRKWNKRPKFPNVDEDHPEFETLLSEHERQYMDPAHVAGAIPICHLGCNLRHWLVVTGREAGHVWVDERADDAGLYPLATLLKRRFTFGDWYHRWLTASLRAVGKKRT